MQTGSFEPALKFKTEHLNKKWNSLCKDVLNQFRLPPNLRLICCFDDENPKELHLHGDVCGFHAPVAGARLLPPWVTPLLRKGGKFVFDNLIYIPGTQYSTQMVSFVLIFAHELQHFIQYDQNRKVYEANVLLHEHLTSFEQDIQTKVWEIPYDLEAMIVSRHVAEKVLGRTAVATFVEAETNVSAGNKKELWEFYRNPIFAETRPLVEQYKPQLLILKQRRHKSFEVDFNLSEWWR
jgi:hypothetical protein